MKLEKDYQARLQGFLADGYKVTIVSRLLDGTQFIKLKHRNGNAVSLMFSPLRLRQFTNGNLVYDSMH